MPSGHPTVAGHLADLDSPGQGPALGLGPLDRRAGGAPDGVGHLDGTPLDEVALELGLVAEDVVRGAPQPGRAAEQADDAGGALQDQALPSCGHGVIAGAAAIREMDHVEWSCSRSQR